MEQPNIGNQQPVSQPQIQPNQLIKYAGFWTRFAANFIDGLVLIIPSMVVSLLIRFSTFGIAETILTNISGLLLSWAYFVWMTNKYQATLGKRALGIMVISNKPEPLSLNQIIIRETVGKLISAIILFIGYIMAGFTEKKQALHDMMADTLVVYKDPNKKSNGLIIGLIIGFCLVIPIIGILASIVLVSLNSARNKAHDAAVKSVMSSAIPAAILYQSDKGSLLGFKPNFNIDYPCTGDPIVNISPSGSDMAIFAKSCADEEKYFCDDLSGDMMEVDEVYAKSGRATCDPNNVSNMSQNIGKDTESVDESGINLTNTFSDSSLGYKINYPEGWSQQKEFDKESGVTTVAFLPDAKDPTVTVYVQSIEGSQPVTPQGLDNFIESVEAELTKEKAIISNDKDFKYVFADGTISKGRQFIAEYEENGKKVKQRLVAFYNGNKLYWLQCASIIEQYDSNQVIAQSMLDSWKISK